MEDFVTFEQAKQLKELGFDWNCNHYYDEVIKGFEENHIDYSPEDPYADLSSYNDFNGVSCFPNDLISAPTLTQAQKWLREVKQIEISVRPNDFVNDSGNYEIHYAVDVFETTNNILKLIYSDGGFEYYESALEDAIDEVLKLLKKKV